MNHWLIGILAVGLVLAAFITFLPPEPVLYQNTYYGKLKAACANGDNCCIGSVKNMEAGGYKLAHDKQCPDGFNRVAVKCPTAYNWCEPAQSTVQSMDTPQGIEVTYHRGGGLALWTQRIQWYGNGTMHVQEDNGRYETEKNRILNSESQARLLKLLQSADVALLKDRYVCEYACATELPTIRIDIRTPQLTKTIVIDDFEAVPPALEQLVNALTEDAEAIPDPTPAPQPLAPGDTIGLAQGHAVHACGFDIRLTELGGATGSRNDWKHTFEATDGKGRLADTLTSWGNESHVVESAKLGFNVTVHRIHEPQPYEAVARTIQISVQCSAASSSVESYTACGCGCCGGTEPKSQCLYKSQGDDLQSVIDANKKSAQSPQCALVGCSLGTKYQYCD